MLIPRVLLVSSRTRAWNLCNGSGDINRWGFAAVVKRKPKNFRSSGRATALFDSLTLRRSFFVRNLQRPC